MAQRDSQDGAGGAWKPRLDPGVDVTRLDLSPEEGFLVSRMDGATDMADLVRLTGMAESKVAGVIDRLVAADALAERPAAAEASRGPGTGGVGADLERDLDADLGTDAETDAESEGESEGEAAASHEYRKLYQRELEPLELDARVEMARTATGAKLHALCHDASPRVAKALLENESFGLEHARRLARHHRSGVGLDALVARAEFLRDLQLQRHLFKNAQITAGVLRRIFGRYRMSQVYQLGISHDASTKVRNLAKKAFRKKFPEGSAEERVQIILKTEGRCLHLLTGVALGAKATALLVRRPLHSTLLVRNLARWPSTPPPVLEHLARQPAVRRSAQLLGKILQHPNAPSRLRQQL